MGFTVNNYAPVSVGFLTFFVVQVNFISRPARNVSTGYVSLRLEKKLKKFSFVNGVKKCLADLISGPLDHNLHVGEGIKMFL